MRRPRTLAAAALAVLAAVVVPSAAAVDPFPTSGVTTLTGDHFMVHYSRVDDNTDGDAYVDIAVDEFDKPAPACITYGTIDPSIPVDGEGTLKRWDALVNPVAPAGAGEIHLQATGGRGLSYHAVAKEVFQLFALKADASADPWLRDATAEWAATHTDAALGGVETNPDRTIDCVGTECGDTDFDRNGGWMLFQYLAEHYGNPSIADGDPAIVKAVWDQAAANPANLGTTDLAAVLPSGVTL